MVDPDHERVARHFDLADLGILHGPPLKGASIVTELANEVLQTRIAAFIVFDELAGEVLLRTASPKLRTGTSYALHTSAIALKEDPRATVAIGDLAKDAPNSSEAAELGMGSLLAASVYGPDEQPIGALVGFGGCPRIWSASQKRKIVDLAYLITQEVALYASFATLEIIARDRVSYRA